MKKVTMLLLALLTLCLLLPLEASNALEPTVSKADQEAAQQVIDQIDALGEITLDSQDAITAAQLAYAKLTAQQKELVTNLDALNAAHTRLRQLQHQYAQNHASDRQNTMQCIRVGFMVFGAVAAVASIIYWLLRYQRRKKKTKKF